MFIFFIQANNLFAVYSVDIDRNTHLFLKSFSGDPKMDKNNVQF